MDLIVLPYSLDLERIGILESEERNYHVFYEMVKVYNEENGMLRACGLSPLSQLCLFVACKGGAKEEWMDGWKLGKGKLDHNIFIKWNYINQSTTCNIHGRDDIETLKELLIALGELGWDSAGIEDIFQVLAGIMHLGNVVFAPEGVEFSLFNWLYDVFTVRTVRCSLW